MKAFAMAFALLLACAGGAAALDVGPAVGASIPPFAARTAQAEAVDWAGVSGEKGAVLVFVRSAKWCPYCQLQLIDLNGAKAQLARRGYALAALSYDSPEELAKFAAKRRIQYTLLSDEGSKMIDAFKLRDPQYKEGSMAYGVPQPAIFVISARGVVQAKLAEEGFKNRPAVSAIIAAVEQAAK